MQYAICKKVDLDRNQLRRGQKLCIMRFMHYSVMHYSIFNCNSPANGSEAARIPGPRHPINQRQYCQYFTFMFMAYLNNDDVVVFEV